MAYNALNNLIDAYIYANGVQAITGQILNGVLKQMVSQLGSGYHLMGVATPQTVPATDDYAMAYFAATAGEYTVFGGITLAAGEVAVLLTSGNGSWSKQTIYNVPTGTADLENTAEFITNAVTDLVNYYTKTEIDTTLADYPTLEDLATALADYYTKTEIDTILAGYTTNTALASALADYYNKNDIDGLLSVVNAALADRYTKDETDTKLADYYKKTETYDKDEVDSIVATLSRQEYIVAWDGLAAPDVTAIPAGVTVTYSGTTYTGTLAASASTVNKIYMVWNGTAYDMYGTSQDGGYSWVPMGTTTVDLSQYATKAEVSQLEAKKVGFSTTRKSQFLTWESGYRTINGVTSQYGMFHSEFPVEKGDKISAVMPYTMDASIPAILKKNNDNSYSPLLSPTNDYTEYEYTVEEDMVVCVNFRNGTSTFNGNGFSYIAPSVYEILQTGISPIITDVRNLTNEKVGYKNLDKHTSLIWESGYRNTSGVTSQYGIFHSEFTIKASDHLKVKMPYVMDRSVPAILKKTGENTYIVLLSPQSDYDEYSYIADEDMVICINFRNGTSTFDGNNGVEFYAPSIYTAIDENNSGVELSVGKNLLDPAGVTIGKYLGSTGTLFNNANYCVSDYIPFTSGKIILSSKGKTFLDGSGYHCLYNASKEVIRSYQISAIDCSAIPWEDRVAYIRFSIPVGTPVNNELQAEKGEYPTMYVPFGEYIPGELIEKDNDIDTRFGHFEKTGTIGNGESITLPVSFVRQNLVLSVLIQGTIDDITIGQGAGVYNGGSFRVTSTSIVKSGQTIAHGLTLTGKTVINMSRGENGTIRIISNNGGVFETPFSSTMGGASYVNNNGNTAIGATIIFFPKNITKKIWFIGDSYMSIDPERWPYWVLSWGYDNLLIDNLPGGGSLQMMPAFVNDLSIGQPDYAVWGLGMNDGTDSTQANYIAWINNVTYFITLCLSRKITPILCTIPSVPTINNESKNTWVRESGFRYIDFAKAVNAQADGTWDAGLLSSDNVHPTEAGAKVLASQVLIDFPEIAYK